MGHAARSLIIGKVMDRGNFHGEAQRCEYSVKASPKYQNTYLSQGLLMVHQKICTAPLSKNAVSSFQISCKLLSFTLIDSWRN